MNLFRCKSTCDITELTAFKLTSLYDLNYLRQYYVSPTSSCGNFLCNLTMQMNDQGAYSYSYYYYMVYINPYNPISNELSKIYRLLMMSINKTDDSSFIDYNQCAIMPKNNNTVSIQRLLKIYFEI